MSRGYRETSLGYPLWVLETSWDMITIKCKERRYTPTTTTTILLFFLLIHNNRDTPLGN